ncbi:MAG: hypothetical protein BWZ07_02958 [Alphaproteobacteria bacterium ADurb.BinA280]|nr:MAG: hypothetical protein BWZ07_02958 [Alphaproteobacteria bacterium ADurb.BinA280]
MHQAANCLSAQVRLQFITRSAPDSELMVDMAFICGRYADERVHQHRSIDIGNDTALCVVCIQVGQLFAQDGCLDFIQPAIASLDVAHIALAPAILAQQADAFQ